MRKTGARWVAIIFFGTVAVGAVMFWSKRPEVVQRIPGISLRELASVNRFEAVILEKKVGTWGPLADNTSREALASSKETPYIMVYMKRKGAGQVFIWEENPTKEDTEFLAQLHVGYQYAFPDAFLEWQADRNGLPK